MARVSLIVTKRFSNPTFQALLHLVKLITLCPSLLLSFEVFSEYSLQDAEIFVTEWLSDVLYELALDCVSIFLSGIKFRAFRAKDVPSLEF